VPAVLRERLVRSEQRVPTGQPDRLERPDLSGLRATRVPRVRQESPDHPEHLALLACPDSTAVTARTESLALLVLLDSRDLPDSLVQQDLSVLLDPWVPRDLSERLETPEQPVL